jgi:hypothetical protein
LTDQQFSLEILRVTGRNSEGHEQVVEHTVPVGNVRATAGIGRRIALNAVHGAICEYFIQSQISIPAVLGVN